MPEIIPDHVPSPRTLLAWDGTAYRPIHIDALGNIQVDVVASALPAGAATAAAQALALAQLQLIEDMRDALQSVATDRLIVRGEDQLYSIKDVLGFRHEAGQHANDGYITTPSVPAGEIWKVTNISGVNRVRATTTHEYDFYHLGTPIYLLEDSTGWAASVRSQWIGEIWMAPGDFIRVSFIGGIAGDTCRIAVAGHRMTLET